MFVTARNYFETRTKYIMAAGADVKQSSLGIVQSQTKHRGDIGDTLGRTFKTHNVHVTDYCSKCCIYLNILS